MRPNRQFPKGLPHNARWTVLDSLSLATAIDGLARLASPRYEANASHPIYEMSSNGLKHVLIALKILQGPFIYLPDRHTNDSQAVPANYLPVIQ